MVFKSHYNNLCNYANTFIREKDEAEEIVQHVFVELWERHENLEIKSSHKSYLYAMVRNSCLNVIKHQKVRQKFQDSNPMEDLSSDSPTDEIEKNELEGRIEIALRKLPEQCRIIFKMSRFENLKYAEIAERLGISIKTVENQMGKALRIMRDQLKDFLPVLILLSLLSL